MMDTKFHSDLEDLAQELIAMGRLANRMLDRSVRALVERDMEAARWVVVNKDEVSRLDDLIEDEALRLLVLYQPMAGDMRKLATILKMITYLERVGRYAKNIANAALELEEDGSYREMASIPEMGDVASRMVSDAIDAFEAEDVSGIMDFDERDDRIDKLRYKVLREGRDHMMATCGDITPCTHYIMIARYLERVGDHACKMAEKVHYMVTGKRIELS